MTRTLLVLAPNRESPFVQADVAALGRSLPVELLCLDDVGRKPRFLLAALRRLRRGGVGAVLMWFLVPAYALEVIAICRLLRLPVVVVTGGLDVDYVRELDLGGLKWPHNRVRQRLGLRTVDLVLAFSRFAGERVRALARPRELSVVPMGVDVGRFRPAGEKERLALTVCFRITRETALLKGLPAFVEAARLLPDVRFVVVGHAGTDGELERLQALATPNLSFTARFVSDDELLDLYRRAAVYVQVSAHEGFGLAAAEAMACGCVPVVTAGHALDEVVGEAGLRVPFADGAATAEAISSALASPELGTAARQRIVTEYPLDRRVDFLLEVLGPLL